MDSGARFDQANRIAQREILSESTTYRNDGAEIPHWIYDADFDAFAAFDGGLQASIGLRTLTTRNFAQGIASAAQQESGASDVHIISNDNSLPNPSDALRIALIVQDMASFDARSAAETERRSRFGDGMMDYFVA